MSLLFSDELALSGKCHDIGGDGSAFSATNTASTSTTTTSISSNNSNGIITKRRKCFSTGEEGACLANSKLGTIITRRALMVLLFSQILSLLNTATGVFTTLLTTKYNVNIPTTQSFVNYFLLFVVFMPTLLRSRGGLRNIWREGLNVSSWKYLLLAVADVEANFLIVKAYQYTTITSAMLLDCFTIPTVMLLSRLFLRVSYRAPHFLAVLMCLGGMGLLVYSDVYDPSQHGPNPILGDVLCICASILYGISNVGQEAFVKKNDGGTEFLAMIGMFGTLINGIQAAALEHKALAEIAWNGPIVGYLVGFSISLFLMYALTPKLLQMSNATFMNLGFLTSNVFAIISNVFLFGHKPSVLFYVSFSIIFCGLCIYNWKLGSSPDTPDSVQTVSTAVKRLDIQITDSDLAETESLISPQSLSQAMPHSVQ